MNNKIDELTEVKRQLALERKINLQLNKSVEAYKYCVELMQRAKELEDQLNPPPKKSLLRVVY